MERVKCKQLFAQLESLTGEQFTALLATMRLRQDLGGIVRTAADYGVHVRTAKLPALHGEY